MNMINNYLKILLIGLCLLVNDSYSQTSRNEILLVGSWELALDSLSVGPENLLFNKTIRLPNTLEDASVGNHMAVPPPGMNYLTIVRTMLMPDI